MPQVKTSPIVSRIMKAPMAKAKRARKTGSDPAIDRLRAICLALPETTEKIAWGEPTFRVRGKLFAQLDNHHHGADHLAVWLPMPLGAQESLVYMDPVRYFVPPYVGGRGWVGVRIDRRPNWKTIGDLLREAYCTVAPGRLAASLRSEPLAPKQSLRRAR